MSVWQSPFCGCFSAMCPCLIAFCFPVLGVSCLQCSTKSALDGSKGCVAFLCACFLGCYGNAYNRSKVRLRFGIKGSYLIDCLMYAFCLGVCAVVQEYREARERKVGI